MPQLNPFYFTNETVLVFTYITFMLYILSRHLLPESFRTTISRYITEKKE